MPINNVTAHNSPQEEVGKLEEQGEEEAAAIRGGAADGSGDWN